MLLQQLQLYIKTGLPLIHQSAKLLLAVSGGIDSVVMTDLLYKSGFDFSILHCNFKLRNDESERDEFFVKELAKKYEKEFFVKRFETKEYALQQKLSTQEAARKLRYDWFEEMVNNPNSIHGSVAGKHYLATAHNADDNIETMLMFLFRGTGIHGLTGIKNFDKERKIIRPLLFATRKEITAYANENNISWVEDSSNASDKYTRNFFRRKIIPLVEEQYANTKENLMANIQRFKETEFLYKQAINEHKKSLLIHYNNEVHIPILKLQKTKPLDTILWEIIRKYNFHTQQIDEIKKLFVADNSSYVQSSSHRIIKNRNWLIIAQTETIQSTVILVEEDKNNVQFENGRLQFEKLQTANYTLQTSAVAAQIDAKQIRYPLIIRKWKQGDYFYPLGMQKKKKLSRFFIDLKLSATQKENIYVLEMNKKIIWVIGYRIDDRFKITAETKDILYINFTAAR